MNHLPKAMHRISRRRLLASALTIAPLLVGADALFVEPNWLSFETIEIPINGLRAAFDGYRIAMLSDVHFPRHMPAEFVRRAVKLGSAFKPDLWVFGGDFVDAKGVDATTQLAPRSRKTPDLSGLFDQMVAPDGVVGVLGNHDNWLDGPGVRSEIARSTPIRLIDNQGFVIERAGRARLAIGGVGDMWTDRVDPIAAFNGVGPDVPRVLVSHNPDLANDTTAKVRVDLQLSGHMHGGEVRVPFGPAPSLPSRYGNFFRQGLVAGSKHRVYVTRGICRPRRVRFWCRPEVTGIVLRSG